MNESAMNLVELSRIVISETNDEQVIVLREVHGDRSFPIVIGIYEAAAIDRRIRDINSSRPLTHDLVRSVIRSLGAVLDHVEVTALTNGTFFANLILFDAGGDEIRIDSRSSDAVVLALQDGAEIYVSEDVLAAAGSIEAPAMPGDADPDAGEPGFESPDDDEFGLFSDSDDE